MSRLSSQAQEPLSTLDHNRCVQIADDIMRNKNGLYDDIHNSFKDEGIKLTRDICLDIGLAAID